MVKVQNAAGVFRISRASQGRLFLKGYTDDFTVSFTRFYVYISLMMGRH